MASFEQELKNFFKSTEREYKDNSASFKLLDFTLLNFIEDKEKKKRNFYLEVKEKRQKYNTRNWDMIPKEEEIYSFIMDDLSARKVLAYAPFSGLLIRDYLDYKYYWFSVLDMYLIPKVRVNRPIRKGAQLSYKGKWIIDFRSGLKCDKLSSVFGNMELYAQNLKTHFSETKECYGDYHGEGIAKQGIVRTSKHWKKDVDETR